jgi:quinol monooxygenase YgiN
MTVAVIVEFEARAGAEDDLARRVFDNLVATRDFAGCESVQPHRGGRSGQHIMLYELWDSREAHRRYVSWRSETGEVDTLIGLCAAPPVVRVFAPVAE